LQDESAEDKRAFAKLEIGVPILRMENEEFCAKYDEHVKPLPYHQKLAFMKVPLDFPVTSLMTTKQKTQFLDALYIHYTGLGVKLTEPEGR
jgi:hypothetical protein